MMFRLQHSVTKITLVCENSYAAGWEKHC